MARQVRRIEASFITRLRELEDEKRRLKKMYTEERLKAEIIQEVSISLESQAGVPDLSGAGIEPADQTT